MEGGNAESTVVVASEMLFDKLETLGVGLSQTSVDGRGSGLL